MRASLPFALVASLVLAACGGAAPAGSSSPPSTVATAPDTPSTTSPSTVPAVGSTETGSRTSPTGSPQTGAPKRHSVALRWTSTTWSGTRDGLAYTLELPEFSGGDAAGELNRRVRASALGAVSASAAQVRPGDPKRTLDGTSRVTTNDGRTVQVRLVESDFLQGTAHTTDSVRTVVIAVATRRPVTLDEVFTQGREALKALAPHVKAVAVSEGEAVTEPAGLSPREANWAAWQSTDKGMAFSFQDFQLGGHGLREYTVPWSVVRPLMSPTAYELLGPG